jgi:hypothetical protein
MSTVGRKIIDALQEAVTGNFARVTVGGCTWVRKEKVDSLRSEVERLCAAIKGAEIAIVRDEDSAAAAQILIAAQAEEVGEA